MRAVKLEAEDEEEEEEEIQCRVDKRLGDARNDHETEKQNDDETPASGNTRIHQRETTATMISSHMAL
jgi:hypothetical protein